jgi:hypothetical protein
MVKPIFLPAMEPPMNRGSPRALLIAPLICEAKDEATPPTARRPFMMPSMTLPPNFFPASRKFDARLAILPGMLLTKLTTAVTPLETVVLIALHTRLTVPLIRFHTACVTRWTTENPLLTTFLTRLTPPVTTPRMKDHAPLMTARTTLNVVVMTVRTTVKATRTAVLMIRRVTVKATLMTRQATWTTLTRPRITAPAT